MNFYEKIKSMSIDEMTEFFVEIYVGSFFSVLGSEHVPTQEFIKSMPQYEESFNATKKMLLEER